MGNKKPVTKDQRKAIGGMWADIDQPDGSSTVACEMRFYANVPTDDHNPAELICKQLAKSFEDMAAKMRQLAEAYYDAKAVPIVTVEDLQHMKSLQDPGAVVGQSILDQIAEVDAVMGAPEEIPGETPPAQPEKAN